MDLLNGSEWEVLKYPDGYIQVVFDSIEYWMASYEEVLSGRYHVTFNLNPN